MKIGPEANDITEERDVKVDVWVYRGKPDRLVRPRDPCVRDYQSEIRPEASSNFLEVNRLRVL